MVCKACLVMTTEQRNWYLSSLGIVQYVPRDVREVSVAMPLHIVANQSPALAGGQISKLLDSVGGQSEEVRVVISSHKTKDITDGDGELVPNQPDLIQDFRLACWHPTDDILVVNEIPVESQPDREQLWLLSNLLKAVGRLSTAGLPPPELIDWPIGKNMGADSHTRSGAISLLSTFLEVRVKKHDVLWVLLMGELPEMLFSPLPSVLPDLVSTPVVQEIAGRAKVVITRSLQDMLSLPEAKIETWNAIKHLVKAEVK